MEQLEMIKGKSIIIPKMVNRYLIAKYNKNYGWETFGGFYTTPESALENFYRNQENIKSYNQDFKTLYYKIIEIKLEIPIINES